MQKQSWFIKKGVPFLSGIFGAALLVFMSWRQNTEIAVWLIPFFTLFAFRRLPKLVHTVPVAVLCVAAKVIAMHGGWDIDLGMEIVFGFMVSMPLIAALYLDRILYPSLGQMTSMLVFPAAYTALDFLLSMSPVGMTFSVAYTQSRSLLLMQSASLMGSFFIGFVVMWSGPVICSMLGKPGAIKDNARLFAVYGLTLILMFGYGSVKQWAARPDGDTVRIGSITVEMPADPWSITDAGTPREDADSQKAVFTGANAELFRLSLKAVDAGAKVVFWSEGNYVIYEDQYDLFIESAREFAVKNDVYLMATPLVLHYGTNKNDNLSMMFGPDGIMIFRYEKTNSWYPTDSDGIIPIADTPYGRIGTAICFDMDFPAFIRQAEDADIMLVPAYDTKKISPYHTYGALVRGIENGFSVVRQCNDGESAAADYNGNLLSSQNFFTVKERLMISDVPTKGIFTPYNIAGDWFAYLDIAFSVFLIAWGLISKRKIKAA